MYICGATREDLERALASVNEHFANNIIWNRLTPRARRSRRARGILLEDNSWDVTLRVADSKRPGARFGRTGRRMVAACWHVHGHFLDALPPDATIYTLGWLKRPGDPWQDWNAGSVLYPVLASLLCHCGGWYGPRSPSPMAQSAP